MKRIPIKIPLLNAPASGKLLVPNDKVSKEVITLENSQQLETDLVLAKTIQEVEKYKKATSRIFLGIKNEEIQDVLSNNLRYIKCFTDESILRNPLSQFNKAVLSACLAEQYFGNEITSINNIYRNLGGQGNLHSGARKAIYTAINCLSFIKIRLEVSEAYENFDSLKGKKTTFERYLLPCEFATVSINGQIVTDAVKFLAVSPLFAYANDKGQTLLLDQKLMKSKNPSFTKDLIEVKFYLGSRLAEMKRSNKLGRKILVKSIFATCVGETITKQKKSKILSYIDNYMNNLVDTGEIKQFTYVTFNETPTNSITQCSKILLVL